VALRPPAGRVPLLRAAAGRKRESRVRDLEDLDLHAASLVPHPRERAQRRPAARALAPWFHLPPVPVLGKCVLTPTPRDEVGGAREQLLGAGRTRDCATPRGFRHLGHGCDSRVQRDDAGDNRPSEQQAGGLPAHPVVHREGPVDPPLGR
jgi:hypothetical protein